MRPKSRYSGSMMMTFSASNMGPWPTEYRMKRYTIMSMPPPSAMPGRPTGMNQLGNMRKIQKAK